MSSKNWAKKPGFRRKTKILGRGKPNRGCLHTKSANDVESYFHATKGWRSRTEPQIANNAAGDLFQTFLA
jgi:hypothetical protein